MTDWFFKADDDTYTIMENLREYIATKDPNLPWFLGRRFKFPEQNVSSYLTGGPGKLSSIVFDSTVLYSTVFIFQIRFFWHL